MSNMKFYNSLTRNTEEFKPNKPGHAGVYTCGPTVYDYLHIGNLRSFIFSDLLLRLLKLNGYKTTYVMNVTDVDDKTIKRSQTENKPLQKVTEFYTRVFLEDLKRVNNIIPDKLPKATDEISGMVELIKTLLEKGFAYKTPAGDIYFDISKFESYGKLAQIDLDQLKQNAEGRLDNADEYEKEDIRDFALWKAYDQSDGDVFWETELGKGRPGWHIECSVMSTKYLSQPFDIHVGGVDLIFPHHTNEIAQSEAAYGKPLANYWLHPEHLLVDNSKMAKSKKNFFTSKDVLDKGYDLMAFRYFTLIAHYKSKLNFTWEGLTAAQNALNNLYQTVATFDPAGDALQNFVEEFKQHINNDLDTPNAVAVMWKMLSSDNKTSDKLATLLELDEFLGLRIKEVWEAAQTIPEVVKKLAEERETARKDKDYLKSDELRKAIESNGYLVDDTADGVRIKKKF
jgi:cysteinyl-tRNA synthetase